MSYRPDEQELMAYLYGELDAAGRAKIEQYFLQHPQARTELEKLGAVASLLRNGVEDKEVIAPPLFVGEPAARRIWDAPYLRTVLGIAASLLILLLAARLAGTTISVSGNEMKLSFGPGRAESDGAQQPSLTPLQVQEMINTSMAINNQAIHTRWDSSQQRLAQSIRENLVLNSGKMDQIVREASGATKQQVEQYIASLQAENMKMVRDYFTLTAGEQKQYIEELLVDFAKYVQQQRNDDLQLVQLRLNSLERNTNTFQQETEQILTSIISGVGPVPASETKY